MEHETGLTVREEVFALPEIAHLKKELAQVRMFQAAVKELLIPGHDFGTIPGTDKPTLLKPGAEKIDKILKLADTYEEIATIEDWDKPLFFYKIKCRLILMGTDVVVSEGMGSCSSMENKYRYRWAFQSQLPQEYQGENNQARANLVTRTIRTKNGMAKQYRLDNEDIYTLANTILKMGKKRAHIDASLSAGRLSDVFTQDIEDIVDMPVVEKEPTPVYKDQSLSAEEVTEDMRQPAPQPQAQEHFCKKHNTRYFKTEKMKAWAHPVKNEDGSPTLDDKGKQIWCSEPATKPAPQPKGEYAEKPKPQAKTAVAEPEPEEKPELGVTALESMSGPSKEATSIIDLPWLKESLEKMNWTTCVKWMNEKYKLNGKRVSEIVKGLTPDQQKEFTKEVQSRLEASGF